MSGCLKSSSPVEMNILLLSFLTIAIRIFGNASVVILVGMDPRHVPVRKRLIHWFISLGASLLAMVLCPLLAELYES